MPDKRPLDVLVLTSVFPRHGADAEVPWLRTLLGGLAARGHRLRVVAPSWKGLASHEIDGIPVLRFRYAPARHEILTHDEGAPNKLANRPWMQLLAVPYILSGAWTILYQSLRRRPDLIHANWPFPHALMALPACWLLRIPLVTHFYGAELLLRRKKKWVTPFLAWSARASRRVLAISRYTADQVREIAPVEVDLVPYGASSRPAEGVDLAYPPPGPPRILFVGRHVERKGIPVLIAAFEQMQVDATLVIAGHGDQTPVLKARAEVSPKADRIEFPGRVPADELSRLYAGCSVFCLPAIVDRRGDTEGLGTVPIEAYEHLRPVVCSDVGGIPDVVRDGETGLLVPPGDPDALARALDRLLADPALAGRMAEAGRAFSRSWFSWDRIWGEIDRIWGEAARATDAK